MGEPKPASICHVTISVMDLRAAQVMLNALRDIATGYHEDAAAVAVARQALDDIAALVTEHQAEAEEAR
jgi:hypothetical protein